LLWQYPLSTNTLYLFQFDVIGRQTDNTNRALYSRRALYYRTTGDATLQGSVQTIGTDIETDVDWTVQIEESGVHVQVNVNGDSGQTINWVMTARWQAVSANT
jgi:hypothetical protein